MRTRPCKQCGGLLVFVQDEEWNRKRPFDADPSDKGTHAFLLIEDTQELTAVRVAGAGELAFRQIEHFTSHFDTCPAEKTRRRRRPKGNRRGWRY